MEILSAFVAATVKILALMTPPAVLSAYLSGTRTYDRQRKRSTALRTGLAVCITGLILYFFGEHIFSIFGFTLDAFRVGAGSLLFLTAVNLMNEKAAPPPPPHGHPGQPIHPGQQGQAAQAVQTPANSDEDISVVPLAIPLCMGPASIGTVMVLGASASGFEQRLVGAASLVAAAGCITLMLLMANRLERLLRKTGIAVLSKLTGLLLSAIAAQVIFTGLRSFMGL